METPKSRNSHLAQFCCALKIDNSLYPQFPIGNVTDEVNSIMGNTHMEWTPYGKISQVTHPGGNPNNLPNLAFAYDATQNRVRQDQGYPNNLGGGISKSTFYVRDAQGNPMAIYEQTNDNSIELKEMPLYGSSRLGSISTDVLISNNAINGNVSSSLTFTPDQILHTENNYLLFGLMDVTLANQPLELLATVNQPSPVFQPYPQNTVTNYTSSTTPNYQNTALAEDVQGNMTIGQTVNTLLSNNSPMCFDKNQLMVSNSSQIGAGLNISSQSIIMPIIPTSDGSNPTCYVVFSIKDNHLFAYKLCYDLLGQASFIWQKQLTTGTAIPPLQNTFALSADFTSTDGKIDLYLRRTTSNSNTQIIRLRYPNNAFNSDGTGIPLWESSQAIGTAFTFSPTDPFSATTPEIQISPNGKQLAVANNAGDPEAQTLRGVVRLYRLDISNLATQTATIARLPYTTASPYNKTCIRSIDYSPDGNYLYAIFRKNGTEEVRRAFLSPPAGTDIIFQPLIPTAPIQNILNSPGSQFTSTVRRGKNQRMYVAFRTKPYIYSISEPDNTTLTVADNIHINIAYTYPIETPSLATLRGNINAQAHLQYLRNPKMLPLLATQERGQKQYELTDHLGNVRTTFSDIKQAKATDTPKLDTYTAQGNPDVTVPYNLLTDNDNFKARNLTLNNYYPYGMLQSARSVSTGDYRFGFNGMEQTKGVQGNGQGNFYDYKNRDYDSWGIRFKRLDPIAAQYPMLSPYQFASNRPIDGIDLDGKEWAIKSVEDGVVTLSLTASVYVPNNIGKIPEKFIEETKVAMEELANNSQWVTNDGQKVRLEVTLNPVDKQKKSTDESEGYYINVVASHHAANGNTESGATTQKAYINLYLNGRESNLVARTLLHETIAHGWSLEHPYVSTSDLYNDYKVAATQVFENMGKRGAKCDKCNAINQNLSTTVQIPPISFNGIPTEGDEENTDYGNALLYNIHFPSNTGPQGTQLLPVQLNKGINQINRQATPPSIPSISINQVKANN